MTHLDPRIGILNSGVHYAFINGYDKPEFRGTREEVEVALGICEFQSAAPKPCKPSKIHRYEVLVTPSVIGYSSSGYGGGSHTHGSYTIEVYAKNAREAVKKARAEYRDEEGRFAPTATYKATKI